MYLGHKHVENRPNCSHKLATFLKYHMPLSKTVQGKKTIQSFSRKGQNPLEVT